MYFLLLALIAAFILRLGYLLIHIQRRGVRKLKRKQPVKTVVVIGSGGHTAEILRVIQNINPQNYSPRLYVMAENDKTSEVKIHSVETTLRKIEQNTAYDVLKIPRSRNVKQSYVTSIWTTLQAIMSSFPIILKHKPDLILCNGPGTCIPVCGVAFLLRILFLTNTVIVFIESVCRVNTLSVSGHILLFFADELIVQWPQLQQRYKRVQYFGRL